MAKKSKMAMDTESVDSWQAESDARTLTEASDIRKDKERLKAAIEFAKTKLQQIKGMLVEAAEDAIEEGEGDEDGA